MMRKSKLLYMGIPALLFFISCNKPEEKAAAAFAYPETKKTEQADEYFGVKIADPYRWLEDDQSAETGAWVDKQNELTFGYLKSIPYTEKIKARLSQLWDYEKIGAPFKKGGNYFYYANSGLQNQSVLYLQKSLDAPGEVLLDPNQLSTDGTVALGGTAFSKDGKYMSYQISRAGSDWAEIYVMEVATKKLLDDKVMWVKFSDAAWQGNGFYYSRFDEPAKGEALKESNTFQKVYYHKVGTPQADDRLVYEDKANPNRGFNAIVTDDERFMLLSGWENSSGNNLMIKDLSKPNSDFVSAVPNFDDEHILVGSDNDKIYLLTSLGAPNKRLVQIDPKKPSSDNWTDVIPEGKNLLELVSMGGGKFFASYLVNATNQIVRFDLSGKQETEIALPALGLAAGFEAQKEAKEVFYTYSSFTTPAAIYKYDIASGTSSIYKKPKANFDPEAFETKQVFYKSADGTEVPMFIVHKKGLELNGKNPTYLYSYGGFNVNLTPSFKAGYIFWLEQGGVFAMPNIRGGGEFGEKWHDAGSKLQKKNTFDDFIAAADYLTQNKYTSKDFLAISGRSNGGLLVGATMTIRPDLCKVAFPGVGVLDMLRYQNFTIGRAWAADYGTSEDSKEMFEYLKSYSPLHNVKETEYPATLVLTADHDDRVVPAHSFKFIAELQSKQKGSNPVFIRIEKNAGHGAGKPTSMVIEEWADMFAFAFKNMGVDVAETKK